MPEIELLPRSSFAGATSGIDTERLQLRRHGLADLDESAAMWADAEVTRFIGGKPLSEEESWTRLLRHVGHWSVMGFGYWVAREKASGRFVGEIGFADFKRRIEPSLAGLPECGWVLAAWAHGRGFATEAVHAAHAWGQSHFGSRRTVCMIAPANSASLRVAEKCGYKESARTTYKERPVIILDR